MSKIIKTVWLKRIKKLLDILRVVGFTLAVVIVLACFMLVLVMEQYPIYFKQYLPDFNLLAKEICIPDHLRLIREDVCNLQFKVDKTLNHLESVKQERDLLKQHVETIDKLIVSEAYDVKPSKSQLLKQAIKEDEILKEKKGQPPGVLQMLLAGFVTYVILQTANYLSLGWG